MGNQVMNPMRIWQSLLFTTVPAISVYAAQWVVAPAISAWLRQPFLVAYLICWGTTEVCFFAAALVAYRSEGNSPKWKPFVERYRLSRPRLGDVVWAIITLVLMLITNQALAFTANWLATIPAFSPHPSFPPELSPTYKIDQHGRQVLNFQITMALSLFAAAFLLMLFPAALILMGEETLNAIDSSLIFLASSLCLPLPMILIGFFCTYQGVVNAVRTLSDKPIHYTLSIPFVK